MKVTFLGSTTAHYANMAELTAGRWEAEGDGTASDLVEFAGRACYQSWDRPNPVTASNDGYIRNIINQQHFSVLEHGSVSFHIAGVSRSLTHELVRHRHFSFSQLSQRFVEPGPTDDYVVPPLFEEDSTALMMLHQAWLSATRTYLALEERAFYLLRTRGMEGGKARKQAREAARAVLPNMTPTQLVVTGNHRTWREFLVKRGTIHADAEIRRLAVTVYDALRLVEPAIYQDFRLVNIDHGDGQVTVIEEGGSGHHSSG